MTKRREERPEALLIAGPTASGKSALAMRLAERLGGMVINADSMQVYADLRILTARPSVADERRVPHALYGTVDGASTHSVSLWLRDVARELDAARETGRLPILVGGSGLYLKALTQGLSDIPQVPDDVRAATRQWAQTLTPPELHAELLRRDPQTAAGLRPTDPQRLIRALEVHAATGRSLISFQEAQQAPHLRVEACTAITLDVPRSTLREAVERRLDRMIEDGALAEVAALAARGLSSDLPIMRALGVAPLLQHLGGTLSLDAAVADAKAQSRRYLKRQDTFFRTQLGAFAKSPGADAEVAVLSAFGHSPQFA